MFGGVPVQNFAEPLYECSFFQVQRYYQINVNVNVHTIDEQLPLAKTLLTRTYPLRCTTRIVCWTTILELSVLSSTYHSQPVIVREIA
jgi:hypothetical protein